MTRITVVHMMGDLSGFRGRAVHGLITYTRCITCMHAWPLTTYYDDSVCMAVVETMMANAPLQGRSLRSHAGIHRFSSAGGTPVHKLSDPVLCQRNPRASSCSTDAAAKQGVDICL